MRTRGGRGVTGCGKSEMKYDDLCKHYYSLQTYEYVLEDAYAFLMHDIARADKIYQETSQVGYKSVIELTGRFVTYLETMVAIRACARKLYGFDPKGKGRNNGELGNDEFFEYYSLLEAQLPIIDAIWWCLRNEIHHSRLPQIRPSHVKRLSPSGRDASFTGHYVPTPHKYEPWVDDSAVKTYFFGEEVRTFAGSLQEHYEAICPLHTYARKALINISQEEHGQPIRWTV